MEVFLFLASTLKICTLTTSSLWVRAWAPGAYHRTWAMMCTSYIFQGTKE